MTCLFCNHWRPGPIGRETCSGGTKAGTYHGRKTKEDFICPGWSGVDIQTMQERMKKKEEEKND